MSRLAISRLIGVPRVRPSKTPERIFTVSVSFRWLTNALWPGTRRSRSGWMSASDRGSRGGQPSTTAPIAAPCDSPHVVTRNSRPQVFPTRRGYRGRRAGAHRSAGNDVLSRHVSSTGNDRIGARPRQGLRSLAVLVALAVLWETAKILLA